MNEKENKGLDDFDDDDIGIARNLRRKQRGSSALKSLLFAFVLVFLVIGSFWVSFLIGKRILVPSKSLPKVEIVENEVVPVPAAPKISAPAPKAEVIEYPNLNAGVEVKKPAAVVKKKIIVPVAAEKKETVPDRPLAAEDAYYKVEAGLFTSKAGAIEKMKELEEQGFEVFAKETGAEGWRVQAGAFKTREKAEKVIADLKAKGFSGKIIKE